VVGEEAGPALKESTSARAERTCGSVPNLIPILLQQKTILHGLLSPPRTPLSISTTKSRE